MKTPLRGLEQAAAMSGRTMPTQGFANMGQMSPTLPIDLPINSRAQWAHERQVGGPLAELPFNKWRAL
jgi:hypothetical protein